MAVAVGSISIAAADTVGTTKTVSGLSFAPTWGYLCWSGRTAAGQGEADSLFGQGIFTGTASRRAHTTQSDHTAVTMAADSMWRNDGCVATLSIAGAIVGRADVDAMLSDGFRLIVDDQFPADLIVGYICGDGANVAIVDITEPGATGNQDYATGFAMNTGLDDKFLIGIGAVNAAVNTSQISSTGCFAVAALDTAVAATLSGSSVDAQADSITCAHCRTGNFLTTSDADAVISRTGAPTWLATGFRLNWAEIDSSFRFSVLAVQDSSKRFFVGDGLTSTGGTNQNEATPYIPLGVLVGSAGRAESASDTTSAHDERIVGAATRSSSRWAASLIDKDAAAAADIGIAFATDAMYVNQSNAATVVQEGAMDLVSLDSTPGFTFVMDDADPSQAYFFYLGFADAPGGVGARTSRFFGQPMIRGPF